MAYLSKECILSAYRAIKESNPKADNSNFSSLQYFLAADRFYRCNGDNPCNSGIQSNRDLFISYVKSVIELDDGHYFKNLKEIYEGKKNINGTIGSNFFSGSSVQDSGRTPGVKYPYPAKAGQSLIYAEDKKIFVSDEFYSNLELYLNASEKIALAIWLLRKSEKFEDLSIKEFRNILGEYYTQKMVDTLLNCSVEEWNDLKNSFMIEGRDEVAMILINDVTDRIDNNTDLSSLSFQQIFYGAPGTGKSHRIKEQLEALNVPKENIFRTTFHPDSDFSTFVGAYKPTMKKQYRYDGKVKAKYYEDDDLANAKKDDIIIDRVIQYNFVPQTFIRAYVRAYQTDENVYLIIEEINRGNCAQIFGDLFQLLDRDENGVSEYTIKADADIKAYLEDALGQDSKGIKDGELCLPSNLFIYATMNTSDQSLFPIDSAFKRRWDWEYEPIKYKNSNWVIEINDNKYSWTSFQKEVNNRIFEATNSEDKMLGDYFVNPKNEVISKKLLQNKVLFYLWNDVCKDGDGDIFRTEDNKDVKFSDLYGDNGTDILLSMMKHLKVSLVEDNGEDEEEEDDDKGKTKYSINGSGTYAKRTLATELIRKYISQNPQMPAKEVVNNWNALGKFVSHFIETQEEYDRRTDKEPRVNIIPCNGENIYVSTNGWGGDLVMDRLINAIPKDWNLEVNKV